MISKAEFSAHLFSSAWVTLNPVRNMRGQLIVIEGLDRAGKTSQCDLLVKKLAESRPVELLKFPDRTTAVGQMIDAYLRSANELNDQTIHLLFSANRWEAVEAINSKLAQGITLVVDRYSYSGAAFSAAKGLDLQWCKAPDIGLPEPDKVIFLDVSEDVATKRGGYGEERYEKQDFQRKVREVFQQLRADSWTWINADESVQSVHKHVIDALELGL